MSHINIFILMSHFSTVDNLGRVLEAEEHEINAFFESLNFQVSSGDFMCSTLCEAAVIAIPSKLGKAIPKFESILCLDDACENSVELSPATIFEGGLGMSASHGEDDVDVDDEVSMDAESDHDTPPENSSPDETTNDPIHLLRRVLNVLFEIFPAPNVVDEDEGLFDDDGSDAHDDIVTDTPAVRHASTVGEAPTFSGAKDSGGSGVKVNVGVRVNVAVNGGGGGVAREKGVERSPTLAVESDHRPNDHNVDTGSGATDDLEGQLTDRGEVQRHAETKDVAQAQDEETNTENQNLPITQTENNEVVPVTAQSKVSPAKTEGEAKEKNPLQTQDAQSQEETKGPKYGAKIRQHPKFQERRLKYIEYTQKASVWVAAGLRNLGLPAARQVIADVFRIGSADDPRVDEQIKKTRKLFNAMDGAFVDMVIQRGGIAGCDKCPEDGGSRMYAYVETNRNGNPAWGSYIGWHPKPAAVNICASYWCNPREEGAMVGTFIHELSHLYGTTDKDSNGKPQYPWMGTFQKLTYEDASRIAAVYEVLLEKLVKVGDQ